MDVNLVFFPLKNILHMVQCCILCNNVEVISEAIADFEKRPVKLMVRDRTSLDATATLVRHEEAKETTIEGVFNEFKKIDSSFGRDVFEDVLMDVELLAAW